MAAAVENAVCVIEIVDDNDQVIGHGTGFHYGSGWVMSNAHNFKADGDGQSRYSNLRKARFIFTVNGVSRVFEPQQRTAFVHHLNPGPNASIYDIDIAMVKLGAQYEYNRAKDEWEHWERQEENRLREPSVIPSTAIPNPPELKLGKLAKATYRDRVTKERKEVKCVINNVIDDVISLEVAEENVVWPLPHGSSGCLISVEQEPGNRNYLPAAIHYAGNQQFSYALKVQREACEKFLLGGVPIISHIGSYVAYLKLGNQAYANKESDDLDKLAKKHSLTIYVPLIGVVQIIN